MPAIRLIAMRYQDDPALQSLGLSPAEWAAFFQAMIKVERNYLQGAVSHAGALGLAQLMPGIADYLDVDPADPLENLDGGARSANTGAFRPMPRPDRTSSKVMAVYDRLLADL